MRTFDESAKSQKTIASIYESSNSSSTSNNNKKNELPSKEQEDQVFVCTMCASSKVRISLSNCLGSRRGDANEKLAKVGNERKKTRKAEKS